MEEITKSQIARLVLGYLKKENCKVAYNSFFKQSSHFEKYRFKNIKILTRFNGMALDDILQKYSEIYSIVISRLEDTDYFDNSSNQYQDLTQQLLYLLDHGKRKSRSSTPDINPSTSEATENETDGIEQLSSINVSASLDVSTTPLKALPGNISETNLQVHTSQTGCNTEKLQNSTTSHNDTETERDESSSGEGEKEVINSFMEVFKETLLAREEFQEKIAHNINEIRRVDANEEQKQQMTCEVDSAIKAIIDKTETDPAFEKLVEEILGVVPSLDKDKTIKTISKSQASTSQIGLETAGSKLSTSQRKSDGKNTSGDLRDLIVFDGIGSSSSPMIVNSNNLLVIKSHATTSCNSQVVNVSRSSGDLHKPTLFYSTPQTVSFGLQQQYNIAEQDIMTMPIIVCDQKHDEKVMVEQGVQVPEKRLKTMMPVRKTAKTTENIVDFITLYNCDEPEEFESLKVESNNVHALVSSGQSQAEPGLDSIPTDARLQTSINTDIAVGIVNEVKTPEQTMPIQKVPGPTPRSGNRSSHVRALDFKFQTPAKEVVKVKESSSSSPKTFVNKQKQPNCQKSSKSLFSIGNKSKEPWDMKFRTALMSTEVPYGNKSEDNNISPNENIDITNQAEKPKVTKPLGRKVTTRKGKKKLVTSTNAEKANETTPLANKVFVSKVASVDVKSDNTSTIKLINLDKSPKYKRKCNIDNKKEVKVTIPKETKITDIIADSDKLVLSPSKLNGSKRSLVEEVVSKFDVKETPESLKMEPMVVPCSSTMRNLTPLLKTPGKDMCPKTPCIYNPITAAMDTPFLKVLNEAVSGVDIASMPTPKSILTPSFPFTPLMESNESYNRPTDYSTSSSYYQPSDSEQGKTVELSSLIKECERLEANDNYTGQMKQSQDKSQVPSPNKPINKSPNKQHKRPQVESVCPAVATSTTVNPAIVEQMKSLGSNVIARKNLSLIKSSDNKKDQRKPTDSGSSSDSSDSGSSSSSNNSDSDSNSDSSDCDDEVLGNETVVEQSEQTRYSLRNRKSPNVSNNSIKHGSPGKKTPNVSKTKSAKDKTSVSTVSLTSKNDELVKNKDKKEISDVLNSVEFVSNLKIDEGKSKILSDLEMKRQRVLKGIKDEGGEKTKKPVGRPPLRKRKPTNSARVLRSTSVKLKDDFELTSSDDEIEIRPFELVETELMCSNSNTSVPDTIIKNEDKSCKTENKQCVANSPEHDEVLVDRGTIDSDTNTKKTSTKPLSKKKTIQKRVEKTVKKPVKSIESKEKSAKGNTIKNLKKSNKVLPSGKTQTMTLPSKVVNMSGKVKPVEKLSMCESAEELSSVNDKKSDIIVSCTVEDVNDKKSIQGSTGQEAKILIEGLKKRGINLIENPNKERFVNEEKTENVKQKNESERNEEVVYKTSIFCQETENIGACISTINTPEAELVYFDISVITESILVHGTSENPNKTKRDLDDDHHRVTKSYDVTVYDDETDAEIKKVLKVTPFECLFDYHVQPVLEPEKNNKVKVLNNVLIKKNNPLTMLYNTLMGDEVTCGKEIEDCRISPLDNRYASDASTSGRYEKPGTKDSEPTATNGDKKRKVSDDKEDNDANKRIKLKDHQAFLRDIGSVDNALDIIHS